MSIDFLAYLFGIFRIPRKKQKEWAKESVMLKTYDLGLWITTTIVFFLIIVVVFAKSI